MGPAPDVNDIAPDFTLDTTERDGFNLHEEVKKGPVLLYFHLAAFGINCTTFMTKLIERAKDFERLGIRLMPINPDDKEIHKKWIERMGSPFEHIIDEGQRVSTEYDAIVRDAPLTKGFTNREFFLIDRDGVIKFKWKADVPKTLPDVEDILKSLEDALR